MKKFITLGLTVTVLFFLSRITMASSITLNNLGSRAMSMGGAFVGLADDFSAFFWNPAGLSKFKASGFGLSGTDFFPLGSYQLDVYEPGVGVLRIADAKTRSQHNYSGLAAFLHPIGKKFVVGIGVYSTAGLGIRWNGNDFVGITHDNPPVDWRSQVRLDTASAVAAYKLNDYISIGAAININYAVFDLAFHADRFVLPLPNPPYFREIDLGQYDEHLTGWGYGATVGVMIKSNQLLSFGITCRMTSTINLRGQASTEGFPELGAAQGIPLSLTSKAEKKIPWPLWLAIGVAVRPTEHLTLTADLHWSQWSKIKVLKTIYKDTLWDSFMTYKSRDERQMNWDNVLQVRVGAEYRINKITLRGGFYTDPSPGPETTMQFVLPNYYFYGITLGVGFNLKGLQIDFGFEYMFAKERTIGGGMINWPYDFEPGWFTSMPGIYNMTAIAPHLSISYVF